MKVHERSKEAEELNKHHDLIEALMEGTYAMRNMPELLPKWTNESNDAYKKRLSTATLFPAFSRTIGVMVGKPFSKSITLNEDVPEVFREWTKDIDLEGNNLTAFSADLMQDVLSHGFVGVLVDAPYVGESSNKEEWEKNGAPRPYFLKVGLKSILGWKTEKVNNVTTLSQLRLAETAIVDDGEYGAKYVNRVRVLRKGSWELWEETTKDNYVLHSEGTTSLSVIPFVPFYGRKKGFMDFASPLLNLAYLNIQHWQDSSDQQKSVQFARVRLAAVFGADDTSDITIGADYFLRLPKEASIQIVQGSAESVNVGRNELSILEEQMIKTGAEILVSRPGQRTATEASNDAEANKSELLRIVEGFEDSLDLCLQYVSDYTTENYSPKKDGGSVSIFKDFSASSLGEATGQLLISLHSQGIISKETAFNEVKRRGIVSDNVEWAEELDKIATQAPELGEL